MTRRALVIAPEPFFSPRGTPFSVYYRTLVTAKMGVRIDLLTYGEGQDPDIPGVRVIRIPRFKLLGPIPIGPSRSKLVLDALLLVWTVWLLLFNRYDIVHAHEESAFYCLFLKPIFGFKLVYDMHSSLPQQLTNFRFTESKALIGFFEVLERGALKHSDAVITICPDLARYALASGVKQSRHALIENSLFDDVKLKGAATRSEGGAPDANGFAGDPADGRPLVLYAGTFEPYQGLEILIKAFVQVHRACPEAFLLLVGGAPRQVEELRRMASELGLDGHCLVLERTSKPVAKRLIEQAAVVVSPRQEGTNTPLKIYEVLASGVPLVATRIWSHTQVLSDRECFLVEPDPGSMAEGIMAALTDEDRRRKVVAAALELYREKYSRPAYEGKIRQLLETLG